MYFSLILKYLHVKITVTMVTQNHQIILSHELIRKNGKRFSLVFEIRRFKNLKENWENQNTEKSTLTLLSVWTSWAEINNFKTNFVAYSKQLDKNKHMAIDD